MSVVLEKKLFQYKCHFSIFKNFNVEMITIFLNVYKNLKRRS